MQFVLLQAARVGPGPFHADIGRDDRQQHHLGQHDREGQPDQQRPAEEELRASHRRPEEIEPDDDRELEAVILRREGLERGAQAEEGGVAPARADEGTVEEEQGQRQPEGRAEADVADVREAERGDRERQRPGERRHPVAGQVAQEEVHPDAVHREGDQQRDVEGQDAIVRQREDRRDDDPDPKDQFVEEIGGAEWVVGVGVEEAARIAQQLLDRPAQPPDAVERIAEVGQGRGRMPRDRPGRRDRHEAEEDDRQQIAGPAPRARNPLDNRRGQLGGARWVRAWFARGGRHALLSLTFQYPQTRLEESLHHMFPPARLPSPPPIRPAGAGPRRPPCRPRR